MAPNADLDEETLRLVVEYCGADPRIPISRVVNSNLIATTPAGKLGTESMTLREFQTKINDLIGNIPEEYQEGCTVHMTGWISTSYQRLTNAEEIAERMRPALDYARARQASPPACG